MQTSNGETEVEHRDNMVNREISAIKVSRRGGRWFASVGSAPRRLFGGGEGATWLEAVNLAVADYEHSLAFLGEVPPVNPSSESSS